MFWYATRAVPWARLAVASLLVLTLMEVVRRWPWRMWPLEGSAVGLLAVAAAWCFDERAATVVDTAPRSLAWRTGARGAPVLCLLAVWLVAVHRTRESVFGHPGDVAWQGVAAMLAASGYACWRRATGNPEPGLTLAAVVVPLSTCWALIRPLPELLPVFPYADGSGVFGDWGVSRALWSALAGVAVVVLAAALCEARWWQRRSRRERATTGP